MFSLGEKITLGVNVPVRRVNLLLVTIVTAPDVTTDWMC